MNKIELFEAGRALVDRFCDKNGLKPPPIRKIAPSDWRVNACAYYRPCVIKICLERCAAIGVAGRAWSAPGYSVDRTPYGVLAHELGHHIDYHFSSVKDRYSGDFGASIRRQSQEKPLTSYCPNDAEWFAEMFRLFLTNSNLLSLIRPNTHNALALLLSPVVTGNYVDVLKANGAPARTVAAAENKVRLAPTGSLPTGFAGGR